LVAVGCDRWGDTTIERAGKNTLARYNPNGSLDTTFGNGGTTTTDFLGAEDDVFSVLIQPDGKVVAVGSCNRQSIVNTNSNATAKANAVSSPVGPAQSERERLRQSNNTVTAPVSRSAAFPCNKVPDFTQYNSDGSYFT
jgi:hypothetical protein